MANTEKGKGNITGYLQNLFSAKESKDGKEDAPTQNEPEQAKNAEDELKGSGPPRKRTCKNCLKVVFVLLSLITVINSIAEIVVTVTSAIFTKLFGSDQSGRLVGMIILAVLAAVTISILVNALVAVFRNQTRPLHAASIVLLVVAAIQAVILGVAVRMTSQEELQLTKSMLQSFLLSKESNPRHSAMWATTQYEMACCGIYGPDDYRSPNLPVYFAPDVPISCCPSYDPSRSELVQEREREACKSRSAFYREGCQGLVVEGFKTSAHLVLGVTVALLAVEMILSIVAAVLVRNIKKHKTQHADGPEKERDSNP